MALRYVDYALSRPREYQLVMSGLLPRVTKDRPSLELAVRRSSEFLGDHDGDYRALVLTLASLVDGAAMLRITGFLTDENFAVLQPALKKTVELLVANANQFRA